LIAATVHAIKTPIEDWRWSVFWMLVVIADAALMSSTVRYRSFKDLPMAARQRSIFVIVIGLLVWLIVAYSEVVLMVIATVFVASGVTLHVVRVLRHYLVSHPAKT
jgi:CDP-diacylglycerol--serine O-phosphatidyltransferase